MSVISHYLQYRGIRSHKHPVYSYPRPRTSVATETTVRDDTPKQQTTVDDSRNPTHTHDEDERGLFGALPVTEVVQEVQYCTSWNNCITALDTVFMVMTILLCWVLYAARAGRGPQAWLPQRNRGRGQQLRVISKEKNALPPSVKI